MINFYCDKAYHRKHEIDRPLEDTDKLLVDEVVVILAKLYNNALKSNRSNNNDSLIFYLFHPQASLFDLSELKQSSTCYHSLLHLQRKKYYAEFTSFFLSKDWIDTRTILLFPIYSSKQNCLEALVVFDLYSNSIFVFSPFQDISTSVFCTKERENFTHLELKISTIIYICKCYRSLRGERLLAYDSSPETDDDYKDILIKEKKMDFIFISQKDTSELSKDTKNYLVFYVLSKIVDSCKSLVWKSEDFEINMKNQRSFRSLLFEDIFKSDISRGLKNFGFEIEDLQDHFVYCFNYLSDYMLDPVALKFDEIKKEESFSTAGTSLFQALKAFEYFTNRPEAAQVYATAEFNRILVILKKFAVASLKKTEAVTNTLNNNLENLVPQQQNRKKSRVRKTQKADSSVEDA